jgi:hypothetical protein
MITVAALILACGRTCFPHTWQGWVVFLASLVVAVVVRVRLFAARNTPQAHRRRMLTLLHRLGGATLVWDAYEGGLISRTWRTEDGTWENLKIGGLHLLDTAGNRVPLPATWPAAEGRRPIEHDCAHEAREIAQHDSTEPGHYVLALPKGTVISTPSHRPAARPEPTPPQAPLPAQPERTPSKLGQAAPVLVLGFLLVAIAVVVVTMAQQML